MSNYKLLSDAILDGARLRGQAFSVYTDSEGNTCALGAAIHAVTGDTCNSVYPLLSLFSSVLGAWEACPVDCGVITHAPLELLIPHLNDHHKWTRERVAGFVATIEDRLGLVEIISDEPERSQRQVAESSEASHPTAEIVVT